MRKILNIVLRKGTSRDIIINTAGNYLNLAFTALFALLLVRILNPTQYGVMSVLLGIAYVLANILDFGTTATIYSYLPSLYEKKSPGLYRFIKSTVYYQSIFSIFIVGALIILFPWLDKYFFKTGAPDWELNLTAISVLLFVWQNSVSNVLFAAKKFMHANIYMNLANLIKTLVIVYMAWQHLITVGSIIFVFGILGPLIFFFLLFIEKKDMVLLLAKAEVKREDFRFKYTLTYFIASQFFNLGQRMDLFLLSYFGLRTDVGYYGLAQKIILTVISTVVSITQVLSPGFSAVKHKKAIWPHLKTSFLYLLIPSFLFLVIFMLPEVVYCFLFTTKFCPTAPLARALSLPFIIYALGSVPMLFLLYTVKKPIYILVSNIIFFLVVSIGCIYLIPLKGAYGPPIAILFAFIVAVSYQIAASLYEYRKLKKVMAD
jgi:O-antigen/teichoic acid export membrane protein